MTFKDVCSLGKSKQHIKTKRQKGLYSQSYSFPVVIYIWESWTIKEGSVLKNWCLQTMVLEKTLESLVDRKKIKLVNPKGNQLWIVIERTDAKPIAPILSTLWEEPTHEKRSWCWERLKAKGKGSRVDEMLDSITNSIDTILTKLQDIMEDTGAWFAVSHGVTKNWLWLYDWTTITKYKWPQWGLIVHLSEWLNLKSMVIPNADEELVTESLLYY